MTTLRRTGKRQQRLAEEERDEAAFQKKVEQLALSLGWWPWHDHDARRNVAGMVDLILLRERVVWMELKAYDKNGKAGRLSGEQEKVRDMLKAAGQEYYTVWDDDDGWAEVCEVLSRGGSVTVDPRSYR